MPSTMALDFPTPAVLVKPKPPNMAHADLFLSPSDPPKCLAESRAQHPMRPSIHAPLRARHGPNHPIATRGGWQADARTRADWVSPYNRLTILRQTVAMNISLRFAAFSALALSCAIALQGCSSDGDSISLQSSRAWNGWQVDCMSDSSMTAGHALYHFAKTASASSLPSSGFSEPVQSASPGGKPIFWVDDSSMNCKAKGFYAQRLDDGSFGPATMGFSYGSPEAQPASESARLWQGLRVDCHHDGKWSSRGRDFYQFRPATLDETRSLPSIDFKDPKAVGRIGSDTMYFVHDSSWSCNAKGFYAKKTEQGDFAPAGLAFSYRVSHGKNAHTYAASQIVEAERSDLAERIANRRGDADARLQDEVSIQVQRANARSSP